MPEISAPVLRIAIVGAGQIGSSFAYHLARLGRHDVTVIARPGSHRLQQLQRDGAIITVKGDSAVVTVADGLDDTAPYDLVIVTLLAHQVDPVLESLRRSAARCIVFMGNTFHPERQQEAIGVERCALGMPFIQAMLTPEGRLKLAIGAGGVRTIISQKRLVDIFNRAGLPAAFEPDMPLWLRCHVPLCVAFQSVAVAGVRRGNGASWSEAFVLARGVRASFRLIERLGYRVYPRSKQRLAGGPLVLVAAMLWFMSRIRSFRELLATGRAECEALVDEMAAAVPLAKALVSLSCIQAMKPTPL